VKLFTIGFTKISAREFFTALREAAVVRVVDVRLHPSSQLSGFAKQDDLAYFLRTIGAISYVHVPQLAPTPELLSAYRKKHLSWDDYADRFLALLRERRVEETIPRVLFAESCLLCSEATPEHCHRRLVAEYLSSHWGDLEVIHLGHRLSGLPMRGEAQPSTTPLREDGTGTVSRLPGEGAP
jgi:uncharacterized protein (DUF488 family)